MTETLYLCTICGRWGRQLEELPEECRGHFVKVIADRDVFLNFLPHVRWIMHMEEK